MLAVSGASGAAGGLHFYQISIEHLVTDYQLKIQAGSSNVRLHSFKFESAGFLAHPSWGPPGGGLLSCVSSRNVSVFGGSGNYGIMNATLSPDIISIDDCDDIDLASLARKVSQGETPAPKAKWIRAVTAGGEGAVEIDDSNVYMLLFADLRKPSQQPQL